MRKTELDRRILELLKKKLSGKVSEHTIRPAITRIRRKNPFLTLNAAAEIFAKKYGESVQKFFSERDREAFGTIRIEKPSIKVSKQKTKFKTLKRGVAKMEKSDVKWDVFICHASEDKKVIADPLYEALRKAGLKVWYDKSSLKLGDRLHKSIDIGIAKSGYGIVILSESFFKKDWPQRELEALAAKELGGQKVILPIWHNVNATFVRSKSLLLSGLVAISTTEGVGNIVNKVLEVVKPRSGKSSESSILTAISTRPEGKESTRSILEGTIRSLQAIDKPAITQTIEQMDFDVLKRTYLDVLERVSFLKITSSSENANIFYFIQEAILERDRTEGAELFEMLVKWYFETTTPHCRYEILQNFAALTTLRHLKEIIVKENRTSDFVAEFGRSNSYAIAGVNAEILQNLKSSLSENDCKHIVDFSIANDQIHDSYSAKNYLTKLLPICETRVDKGKLDQLNGLIR